MGSGGLTTTDTPKPTDENVTFFRCVYKRTPARIMYDMNGIGYHQRKTYVCLKIKKITEYEVSDMPGVCRHCGDTYNNHRPVWLTIETLPSHR